jgi:regulator of sigma E protease
MTFVYVVLAALGLGLLIFIHELGHYWVARRVGIKVEAFSIGFGRAIVSWKRDGVEWRIGWLPVGGYVRMAGTDRKGDRQPHEVPGGFFAARPIDRIKVALAGPAVNFLFAFLAFSLLWAVGGRDKPFAEFTRRVGWVDSHSQLYRDGLRPGDIIESYDDHPVKSARDHLQAPLLGGDQIEVHGYLIDYSKEMRVPFAVTVRPYPHPYVLEEGVTTLGIFAPAQYLLYNPLPDGRANLLPPGSPMRQSGIAYGDRLFWADGQLLFSAEQLGQILSEQKALLTLEHQGEKRLASVPRLPIDDLTWSWSEREELGDWHYALGLKGSAAEAIFIPYTLSYEGVVTGRVAAFDHERQAELFPPSVQAAVNAPLQMGDRIIAVDGRPVSGALEIMEALQNHQVLVIVERKKGGWPLVPWDEADASFDQEVNWRSLEQLASGIGTPQAADRVGTLALLAPIHPVSVLQLEQAAGREEQFFKAVAERRAEIEKLYKGARRERMLRELESSERRLRLGVELQDRVVRYNPSPTTLFANVVGETWRTWKSLLSGHLSPKWIAGPVGIVQVMQYGWALGAREALFWLAVISLNLGILNLLPMPVLDGGQICFAAYEMITRRRIRAEVMERLIIPFVILLIGFFIFVTYQDLSRLLRGLF